MKSLLKILSDTLLQKVESILGRGLLFHAVAGLVLFTLVLILGTIVKFLPKTVGRKIVTKTESNLDDTLRIQIYEAFNKAKIEIALPQQIVHVRERKR